MDFTADEDGAQYVLCWRSRKKIIRILKIYHFGRLWLDEIFAKNILEYQNSSTSLEQLGDTRYSFLDILEKPDVNKSYDDDDPNLDSMAVWEQFQTQIFRYLSASSILNRPLSIFKFYFCELEAYKMAKIHIQTFLKS